MNTPFIQNTIDSLKSHNFKYWRYNWDVDCELFKCEACGTVAFWEKQEHYNLHPKPCPASFWSKTINCNDKLMQDILL